MKSDADVLAEIEAAFGGALRPDRFMPFVADPEFEDHEALLQSRDRDTLALHDVRPNSDPLCYCSPEGLAYYFPCLARFALQEPADPFDWYGGTLLLHLGRDGAANELLLLCDSRQRQAVAQLLEHMRDTRAALAEESMATDDLANCISLWQGQRP